MLLDPQTQIAAEQERLRDVPRYRCEATSLRPQKTINVQSCFGCPSLNGEWESIAETFSSLKISDIAGGVNPGDRRALYYLVRCLRPICVLEIGTHIGASTTHMAFALGMNDRGSLRTVDIYDVNDEGKQSWLSFGSAYSPVTMMEMLDCTERVSFSSRGSLADLVQASNSTQYDLVFLDGNHDASYVYQELGLALGHLAENATMIVHDYFPNLRPLWSNGVIIPGVTLAINRLIEEGVRLSVRPLGALPWATKLGSNVTSLALVERVE